MKPIYGLLLAWSLVFASLLSVAAYFAGTLGNNGILFIPGFLTAISVIAIVGSLVTASD